MKNLIKSIIYLIALTPSVLTAQAWVKSKGHGFYKLDFTSIYAADVFDTKGDVTPFRTLGNYTTSFYGEYGLT
jgi:protein XagA